MEMKKISSGKLRGIGYDARGRVLQVRLDDGSVLQYSGVGEEAWRALSTASSPWSYYRDNIEEDYAAKRVRSAETGSSDAGAASAGNRNPLDDLFRRD